jgi:hypothetical protein
MEVEVKQKLNINKFYKNILIINICLKIIIIFIYLLLRKLDYLKYVVKIQQY